MKKILIITGGSKGIGLATAQLFQKNRFTVINLSRSPIPLPNALLLKVDFAADNWQDSIKQTLQERLADAEQIVLVHNAGLLMKGSVDNLSAKDLRRSLEVNIIAPAILNAMIVPSMLAGSAIIYIGSTLSEKGVANSSPYVIAKHAIAGMMRSTCQDLAGTGIHTSCICPGFTETEMLRAHVGEDEETLAAIAQTVTQKRLIEPEEIAKTIYFCALNPVINAQLFMQTLARLKRSFAKLNGSYCLKSPTYFHTTTRHCIITYADFSLRCRQATRSNIEYVVPKLFRMD